jgi:general L-amino acid transport system substrate-binding protein
MGRRKFALITITAIGALAMGLVSTASPAHSATLDSVRENGFVRCGVSQSLPGFSSADKNGRWSGLDVDLCRALAAAALGSAEKVRFTPLSEKERFSALRSGEVDILSRNTTWTLARDAALRLNFAGVNFYDGQGFMVRRDLGLKSAKELGGATVCLTIGTTTDLNLGDYFRANNLRFRAIKFEDSASAAAAYDARKCDVYTTDKSALAAWRATFQKPEDHVILADIISKEPLGPVVRHGDDQWLDLVRWTLFATLNAEELGVNSANVDAMKRSPNPAIRRLLGLEGAMGAKLGVDNDWAYRIIKQVGNYAESYERNVGPGTPLQLPRGLNALWTNGGLHYPMPVR